jgi:Flp pilus assembly protein TadD
MHENGVTTFGGIVGRVLRDATSFGTAVTSFILGAIVVAVSFIFTFIGNEALAQILVQIIVAVALARFALNGLSGEFRGTILSTAGGSWALALMVAARYLVLNLLWMAPMVFGLWQAVTAASLEAAAGLGSGGGFGGGAPVAPAGGLALALPMVAILTSKPVIAAFIFIMFGLTLLPPIFLIVAVRAERFGQIFSADLWRGAFAGRFADLYVIYAIHGGGMGMMIILAIPVVLLGFSAASEFGILFGSLAFGYMCGLAVTLLGRLCGFFAFGEEHTGPVYATAPAGGGPDARRVAAGFTPRLVHGGAAVMGGAAMEGAPAAGGPAGAEEMADDSGRPPLPDAVERAAAARARFATDRDGALGVLMQLHAGHAPSAPVMHALALCLHEAGRAAEALDLARQAVPLCIARGQVALAAELFATFWKQAKELGLDHEQIDAVASSFMRSGDLGRAVSAYGLALTMDPADRKATKGLLQAADQRLHKEGRPKDAAKIYTFLLQYAPNSPFADDMRRGLAEAEARLARAS